MSAVVYWLLDAEDNVLYIGCTMSLRSRMIQHAYTKGAWWPDVASVAITDPMTREEAMCAEREDIETLHPLHNITLTREVGLLTDDESDLDSFWKIEGEAPIRVRHATRGDLLTKLATDEGDLGRNLLAGAKRKREAAELLPYMTDPTTRLEDAKRAWVLDHPPTA